MAWLSEADLEEVFLQRLAALGHKVAHGATVSPEMQQPAKAKLPRHDPSARPARLPRPAEP